MDMPATFEHAGAVVSATLGNLGLGGAVIAAEVVPGYGEQIVLVLQLPGAYGACRLRGIVRWRQSSGFGVQFCELGARETHAIGQLLASPRVGGPTSDVPPRS
jgi:hypothetical protein